MDNLNDKQSTEEQIKQSCLGLELLEWWEGFRPEGWDIIQHLHNPCINCPTEREQKLAFWISRRLLGNEA